MKGLCARLVNRIPSLEGTEADLMLIEPNGDETRVRCLCRGDLTEIGVDGRETEGLTYLNKRYGGTAVCTAARKVTLGS